MRSAIQDFLFERERFQGGAGLLPIGVDEAGRGPLAGPVVAAAAAYKDLAFIVPAGREKDFALIRDSKALSPKQREKAFGLVHEYFEVGLGVIHPETIDRINILEATFLAMKEAVVDLRKKVGSAPVLLLVDGNQKIPNLSLPQETVVGGDGSVRSIAAASIVAKVVRDRMMDEYDRQYPQYGFAKHKGYGTKQHMEALEKYGPTPVHRTSFSPVAQAILRFRELGILS
jgi:ribonuclease HII